ncbi:MAG TPA: phosphatase PAP2 family protein [Mesotoga infera]|uniref:Phosphatase PAP2 family protein n=1 Tax=Mesotoga infera TaxID=1236046 RepID=A0A7C1CV14_9BACT|nr:phosphatase PAP2 family protein [Mesotoga infera]
MWDVLNQIELSVMHSLNAVMSGQFMDLFLSFMLFLERGALVWILLTVFLLFDKRFRRAGYMTSLGLGISLLIVFVVLKPVFGRLRPLEFIEGYTIIFPVPETYSFPSSPVAVAFAYAVVLWNNVKMLRAPLVLLSSLIALAEVYVYFSYISDVVAGAVIGLACGILTVWLFNKYTIIKPEKSDKSGV